MSDARKMASDLMTFPGHQLDFQKCTSASGAERPICRFYVDSISMLLRLNGNTICPLILLQVATDAFCRFHLTFYNRKIILSDSTLRNQLRELLCCRNRFSRKNETAGIPIKPIAQSGAEHSLLSAIFFRKIGAKHFRQADICFFCLL